MTDKVMNERRGELYSRGLSDREIARMEHVSRVSVRQWRKRTGRPSKQRNAGKIVFKERDDLYARGLTDRAIAGQLKLDRTTIRFWRRTRGLPPNIPSPSRTLNERRQALYNRGLSDDAIAEVEGCKALTIKRWRGRLRLLSHPTLSRGFRRLSPEREAARRVMYEARYSDGRIARAEGINPTSIAKWRYQRGLPAHRQHRSVFEVSREKLGKDPLQERIKRAIGGGLTADLAADAIAQLYLDVSEGRVQLRDVEKVARSYRNKAIAEWANKYGPRSLDAEIGEDGNLRLIDAIADEKPSSWLEEMGATVW